jgi:hypothetical protein
MTLPKIKLRPDQAKYMASPGLAVRRQEVEGGLARHRRDHAGAPWAVEVIWKTSAAGYDYLLSFFRQIIATGAGAFRADLILDGLLLTERECKYLPRSMALTGVSGDVYIASARLEVAPIARDAEADALLIESYAASIDGLPVMALTPRSDGYSVDRGATFLQSRQEMGPSRFRPDYESAASMITASWRVNPRRYQYLVAFYYTATVEGTMPFLISLILDRPGLVAHVAQLVPGTFALEGVDGATYSVTTDMEIRPLARDAAHDAATIAAFEASAEADG